MISHKHKLIVIHTPRCGGTSVETAFGDMTGHHERASWYAEKFPEAWGSYRKMALWRDPIERFLSLWRYWGRLDLQRWGRLDDPERRLRCWYRYRAVAGLSAVGLAQALERLGGQRWTDRHFLTQRAFIDAEGVEVMPMVEGLEVIEQMTGVTMPHLNGAAVRRRAEESGWPRLVESYYEEDYGLCG